MKQWLLLIYIFIGLLSGCGGSEIPQRNAEFKKTQDAVKSYYDYRRLERAGVKTLKLRTINFDRTVSLAYYLYVIAQAFEHFERDSDAVKLYLRLLVHYPLLYEGSQLGVMAENRLRWLVGDKAWIIPNVDDLVIQLERALKTRDIKAVAGLISRDFGFGRTYKHRFAVTSRDGIELIGEEFKQLDHLTVEIVGEQDDEELLLKTTGWDKGRKTWYFALHKNQRLHGWEWKLAYWEQE